MKRIFKGLCFSVVSAAIVYVVIIGIATYFTPDIEKRQDEDDDYDDFVDPELESDAWKLE